MTTDMAEQDHGDNGRPSSNLEVDSIDCTQPAQFHQRWRYNGGLSQSKTNMLCPTADRIETNLMLVTCHGVSPYSASCDRFACITASHVPDTGGSFSSVTTGLWQR